MVVLVWWDGLDLWSAGCNGYWVVVNSWFLLGVLGFLVRVVLPCGVANCGV